MEFITTTLPFEGTMSSFIGGRKENQDTVGYSETDRGLLLTVCDGMGGGPGGKTASLIAAKAIIAYIKNGQPLPHLVERVLGIAPVAPAAPTAAPAQLAEVPLPEAPVAHEEEDAAGGDKNDSDIPLPVVVSQKDEDNTTVDNARLVREAVEYANSCLCEAITLNPSLRGMGTTTTVVLIDKDCAVLAHVGDSRIYQLRRGNIVFRTADHSFVGQLVRDGKLSEEQARLSAKSNIITRALGIDTEVDVDIDIRPYEKGDRFVLCTDGIWGAMPEPQLVKELSLKAGLGGILDSLNTQVETIGKSKGGHHDNFSAIIIETKENSILKETMSTKVKLTGIILAALCAISIIVNIVLVATRSPREDTTRISMLEQRIDSIKCANDTMKMQLTEARAKNVQYELTIQNVEKQLNAVKGSGEKPKSGGRR